MAHVPTGHDDDDVVAMRGEKRAYTKKNMGRARGADACAELRKLSYLVPSSCVCVRVKKGGLKRGGGCHAERSREQEKKIYLHGITCDERRPVPSLTKISQILWTRRRESGGWGKGKFPGKGVGDTLHDLLHWDHGSPHNLHGHRGGVSPRLRVKHQHHRRRRRRPRRRQCARATTPQLRTFSPVCSIPVAADADAASVLAAAAAAPASAAAASGLRDLFLPPPLPGGHGRRPPLSANAAVLGRGRGGGAAPDVVLRVVVEVLCLRDPVQVAPQVFLDLLPLPVLLEVAARFGLFPLLGELSSG